MREIPKRQYIAIEGKVLANPIVRHLCDYILQIAEMTKEIEVIYIGLNEDSPNKINISWYTFDDEHCGISYQAIFYDDKPPQMGYQRKDINWFKENDALVAEYLQGRYGVTLVTPSENDRRYEEQQIAMGEKEELKAYESA